MRISDWSSDVCSSDLLYVLAGQYEHAGTLGELVVQADQASVAQELGGDPSKALAAPKHALQRKLLDGLRYLLKEAFKLNQAGPARSEEHTSELQSLMRISYAVFCLKKNIYQRRRKISSSTLQH